jgi:uncharacterized protein involved in exopolysaccharide biosynthesis
MVVIQSENPLSAPAEVEASTNQSAATPADEEISLLDLLIVIAARRWLILKVILVVVLVAVLVSLLLPFRYTAQTSILPPQESSIGMGMMSQLGGLGSVASLATGGLGLKSPNDLQVAMLKSRTVEDALIDRFHLMERYHVKRMSEAQKVLESNVDIDSGSKDGLIRISFTDRDPKFAEELANGYVEEFKKFSATLAVTEASRRRLFFEQQLGQAKDNLANAEEELKKTEQKKGLIQIDSQARSIIESVAQLRAQIAAKQVQIVGMRTFATGENPDMQIAEQELAGLQAQEERLGATSDALTIPKGNMQESELEYVRKMRDVKYYETIFDLLARQYEAAKVDEARQGALVQVVDRAVVPDHRSSPKRTLIVLGAMIFGMILGVGWAFAAEGYARLSRNPVERARLDTLKGLLARK